MSRTDRIREYLRFLDDHGRCNDPIDWDTLKKLAFAEEEQRDSKNDDVREIVKILGGLGVQHPEYIASVLVNNGIGVKG